MKYYRTMDKGELHAVGKRKILVIVCHGFNSSSRNDTLTAIVAGLNDHDYDTLTFNFSENLGGFDVESQVADIAARVTEHQHYDHVVLLAASFGALPAAISARKIDRVDGLITLNGFFGTAALGKTYRKPYFKFRLAALLLPKYYRILHYYQQELKPEAITVPTLTMHSRVDRDVFIKQSVDFSRKLTTKATFVTLQSANHGVSEPKDRTLVIATITDWLQQTY